MIDLKEKEDELDTSTPEGVESALYEIGETQRKVSENPWKAAFEDALDKLENREPFEYSADGDAVYQQYKKQAEKSGKLAMQDTTAQIAARSGGYGNSYAQTAGQQVYNSALQEVDDMIPELYKIALERYNRETDDLQAKADAYSDAYYGWETLRMEEEETQKEEKRLLQENKITQFTDFLNAALTGVYTKEELAQLAALSGFDLEGADSELMEIIYTAIDRTTLEEEEPQYSDDALYNDEELAVLLEDVQDTRYTETDLQNARDAGSISEETYTEYAEVLDNAIRERTVIPRDSFTVDTAEGWHTDSMSNPSDDKCIDVRDGNNLYTVQLSNKITDENVIAAARLARKGCIFGYDGNIFVKTDNGDVYGIEARWEDWMAGSATYNQLKSRVLGGNHFYSSTEPQAIDTIF